jgi:hypothetical protein
VIVKNETDSEVIRPGEMVTVHGWTADTVQIMTYANVPALRITEKWGATCSSRGPVLVIELAEPMEVVK